MFAIVPSSYARWESEFHVYRFNAKEGIATATVADPTCQPTAAHRCDLRLEGFQTSFVIDDLAASLDEVLDDAIVGTVAPFADSETSNGIYLSDPPPLSASFGKKGDRKPLLQAKGVLNILIYPSADGTVRIRLSGSLSGYVDDREGRLTISVFGNTPQLFDASVPDARPRDAQIDGDATDDDATDDAGGDQ